MSLNIIRIKVSKIFLFLKMTCFFFFILGWYHIVYQLSLTLFNIMPIMIFLCYICNDKFIINNLKFTIMIYILTFPEANVTKSIAFKSVEAVTNFYVKNKLKAFQLSTLPLYDEDSSETTDN